MLLQLPVLVIMPCASVAANVFSSPRAYISPEGLNLKDAKHSVYSTGQRMPDSDQFVEQSED